MLGIQVDEKRIVLILKNVLLALRIMKGNDMTKQCVDLAHEILMLTLYGPPYVLR